MELLCAEDVAAYEWHPKNKADGSEIGINFVDAYIKPLNKAQYLGQAIKAKRRGLKVTVQLGESKGEAIMRAADHEFDVEKTTYQVLRDAFAQLGKEICFQEKSFFMKDVIDGAP